MQFHKLQCFLKAEAFMVNSYSTTDNVYTIAFLIKLPLQQHMIHLISQVVVENVYSLGMECGMLYF